MILDFNSQFWPSLFKKVWLIKDMKWSLIKKTYKTNTQIWLTISVFNIVNLETDVLKVVDFPTRNVYKQKLAATIQWCFLIMVQNRQSSKFLPLLVYYDVTIILSLIKSWFQPWMNGRYVHYSKFHKNKEQSFRQYN